MVVVAVAGGTGGVGKTIIEQLLLSQKHRVLVLSRKVSKEQEDSKSPEYVVANYSDIDVTAAMLESMGVHTVISTINNHDKASSAAQNNLIAAADKSSTTKRFVPSEYGFIATPEVVHLQPASQNWMDSADALRKTSLEWTRFSNGFFLDYWGMPNMTSHLWAYTWAVDMKNCKAAIPGNGDDLLSLTYSVDVAKFVVTSLDLEKWDETSIVVGTDITFNELMKLGEKIQGKKFEVSYDSLEELNKHNPTLLETNYEGGGGASLEFAKFMVSTFGLMTIGGHFHMPKEGRLNDKIPNVKALSAEEFLTKAWGGR